MAKRKIIVEIEVNIENDWDEDEIEAAAEGEKIPARERMQILKVTVDGKAAKRLDGGHYPAWDILTTAGDLQSLTLEMGDN